MSPRLNLGLIGAGRLGKWYAKCLRRIELVRLEALCDRNEDVLRQCADEFEIQKVSVHYEELLSDRAIDAIVIVTPTSTHREICEAAADAKKAIFCEKPLSLSLQEAEAVKAAIERNGTFFHMGYMRRFDPGYAEAKRRLDSGEIGIAVLFKSTSRDPFRPGLEYLDVKHSGGLFVDMSIHDFDLARWYIGDVDSVFSTGGTLAYPEMKSKGDIDNGIVNMKFSGGHLGVVDASRSAVYGYDIQTEILGTKGTLKVGYIRETPLLVMKKDSIFHDTVPYFMQRFGQAYETQLRNFVQNVLQEKEPSISCEDGIASLRIALAARLSLEEEREVDVTSVRR